MNTILRKLVLAGGVAFAIAGPIVAAPISPAEQGDYKLREQHDRRDAQTGNFRPHGTLTTQQRDSIAGQDARGTPKTPIQPRIVLPQHAPN